jgi:hypothetical protein
MMVTGNVLLCLWLLADLVVNTLPCSRSVVGRMVALHARIGQVSDDIKAGFDFK